MLSGYMEFCSLDHHVPWNPSIPPNCPGNGNTRLEISSTYALHIANRSTAQFLSSSSGGVPLARQMRTE